MHLLLFIALIAVVASVRGQEAHFPTLVSFGRPYFTASQVLSFTYFQSTLIVPPGPVPPLAWQSLFGWPGLETNLTRGVLQPVLSFGQSCAPNPNNVAINFKTQWWVSAIYYNKTTVNPTTGKGVCTGGNRMAVSPGDNLLMTMQRQSGSTVWTQTVTNLRNNQTVQFTADLGIYAPQDMAILAFEYHGTPASPAPTFTFNNIMLQVSGNVNNFCKAQLKGAASCTQPSFLNPTTCVIQQCVLPGM